MIKPPTHLHERPLESPVHSKEQRGGGTTAAEVKKMDEGAALHMRMGYEHQAVSILCRAARCEYGDAAVLRVCVEAGVCERAKGGDDADKKAARVVAARRHIVDNILTMRCPSCGQVGQAEQAAVPARSLIHPSRAGLMTPVWVMRGSGRGC